MGMFDWVEWEGQRYQTKDTPRQFCDEYRIDELGRLWVQEYDAEWISDADSMFGGYMRHNNQRWTECQDFSGIMRFYREDQERGGHAANAWMEWEAEFKSGLMIGLKLIEGEPFTEWYNKGLEERGLK